jgi:hypothetical protein
MNYISIETRVHEESTTAKYTLKNTESNDWSKSPRLRTLKQEQSKCATKAEIKGNTKCKTMHIGKCSERQET